jgi:hypothetical protein
MKRNRKAKSKGVAARQGLKEAGRKAWTGRTETGYKAYGLGEVALDTYALFFIRRPGGKSSPPLAKATCLILGGPCVSLKGVRNPQGLRKNTGKSAEAIVACPQTCEGPNLSHR